jgi:hypothetical protein
LQTTAADALVLKASVPITAMAAAPRYFTDFLLVDAALLRGV